MAMFSNAKVGDRAYDWTEGWGAIEYVDIGNVEGKFIEGDVNPTLFWDKPSFKMPKKPFNLKAEYKKLKRKEFKYGEKNYYITINLENTDEVYWLCKDECIFRGVGTDYYTKDYIDNFVALLNHNYVTFEQLEEVIKEVEND